MREVLKQAENDPMTQTGQVAVLHALVSGHFDAIEVSDIAAAIDGIDDAVKALAALRDDADQEAVPETTTLRAIATAIEKGEALSTEQWDQLSALTGRVCRTLTPCSTTSIRDAASAHEAVPRGTH